MQLHNDTYEAQSALADYCRTGNEVTLPGTTPGRLHHYRRLVYNVVEDILQSAYPITYDLLGEAQWQELVHAFFSSHRCQTPQVMTMPQELYAFVKETPLAINERYPYLIDLLYFEWVELEVFLMEDLVFPSTKPITDPLEQTLAFNPEHRLIRLSYPVHRLTGDALTGQQGNYFLLVFREPETLHVRFFELSVLFAVLVEQAIAQQESFASLLPAVTELFGMQASEQVRASCAALVHDLHTRRLIMGAAG